MAGEYGIDWAKLVGNERDIKFARRDLAGLELATSFTRARAGAVQAGGNIGIFPSYLAKHFAAVLTFEPDPYSRRMLEQNCFAQGVGSKVMAIGAALGERNAMAELIRTRRDGSPATHSGVHHVQLNPAGGVQVLELDSFDFEAVDLLYLDVEGFELFALKGAERTVARHRPVIAVEINKSLDALGITPGDVASFIIGKLNYRPRAVINSDRIFTPAEWH